MELVESCFQDQDICNFVPRGGPIYVPDLVSDITRIDEFEDSVVEELRSLEAELNVDSSQPYEDDLSVAELKVFTEEELVDRAFKEAFKDNEDAEILSQHSEDQCNAGGKDDDGLSTNGIPCSESSEKERNESLNGPLGETCENDNSSESVKINSKKRKKRGRAFDRNSRAAELESSYVAKVEQLAKVKQKQDEDKAAARLHSFNGGCKINEIAVPSSEKAERKKSLRFITSSTKVKPPSVCHHIEVSYPEVVLCIEIYHSTKSSLKTQEFLVLGRQTLSELRDSIYCLTDEMMQKAGQHDPSGYFLIEDVFCNDLRDPSAIDYSEPIFDWLRNSKDEALAKWDCILSGELQQKQKTVLGDVKISQLPHFKSVNMAETRFCDLKFRVGAGYLYCHQGDCKHVIVIRDMRLIHPEDIQNRAAYPILTFQMKFRFRKCSVCKIYRAKKVTIDDKWAQENPCYFCDNCYYLLHYTKNGSLLYDQFTVYDYHHE